MHVDTTDGSMSGLEDPTWYYTIWIAGCDAEGLCGIDEDGLGDWSFAGVDHLAELGGANFEPFWAAGCGVLKT